MAAESESDATRRPEAKDGSGTRGTGARSERGRVLKVNCSVWGRGHWCLPCPEQSSGKWPTKRSWRVKRSPSYRHTAPGWQSKTSHYSCECVCVMCGRGYGVSLCFFNLFVILVIFSLFSFFSSFPSSFSPGALTLLSKLGKCSLKIQRSTGIEA